MAKYYQLDKMNMDTGDWQVEVFRDKKKAVDVFLNSKTSPNKFSNIYLEQRDTIKPHFSRRIGWKSSKYADNKMYLKKYNKSGLIKKELGEKK